MNTIRHTLALLTVTLLIAGCETTSQSSSSSSASTSSSSSSSSSSSASSSSSPSAQPSSGTSGSGDSFPAPQSGDASAGNGADSADGYEDSATSDTSASGAGGSDGEVLSDEEEIAVLDSELDKSIAVFDGMIINERATVQDIEDEYSETDLPGESGSEPLFEEGDLSEGGDGDGDLTQAGTVPAPPGGGSGTDNTTGSGDQGSSGPGGDSVLAGAGVPKDIPDGSDDDIVARQIREAAMKEKDPVLREKLWEEYRKYKAGK